jgi:regulator of protease activity HflC (stomatin/prohibitin superfamily)
MERNIQKNGLINLLVLLAVGVAGFAVARFSNSLAGQVGMVFVGLGVLVAFVSWFQMRLEENERVEKMELEELARTKASSTLFESKEAEMFPAQRSRQQFERFFIPIFAGILFLAQAAGTFLLWRWPGTGLALTPVKQPIVAMALFALFFLALLILGIFSATIARLEDHRLLRPSASWILLGGYLCLAIALGLFFVWFGFPKTDFYLARGLCVLLGLVAFETLVALILELYRPRVKGKIARPLYESRLVGLLSHPEGLITTAAQALDYQFGFKVSETWFYRFFERALGWLLLLQLIALFISTAVVFVDPGEAALLERFGRPVEGRTLLGPGPHLKWPWPIEKTYRYRTEQIQSFNVGFTPDPARPQEKAILWTVTHTKEENFLVANREQISIATANTVGGRRAPPVSLLTVSIPVQYQISDLPAWAYNHEDAGELLQNIARREVVRYLVSVDLNEIMSHGRFEAEEALRQRMQAAADERKLGARIIFVGLQDIHPPVKVAPEYEKVVGALHTRQSKILSAQADAIRTNALADARAFKTLREAEADRQRREVNALAQAALFTNQIPAFAAAPSVYKERAYLQVFPRATASARKYILLATNTQDVLQFDLQDKIGEEFYNLTVAPPKK